MVDGVIEVPALDGADVAGMTILHALATRYDRLASEDEAPMPGFAPGADQLHDRPGSEGRYVTTQDERTGEGKKLRPQSRPAPAAPKRTVGIASGAFWDKTSYVLGRTAPDETVSAAKQARDARTAHQGTRRVSGAARKAAGRHRLTSDAAPFSPSCGNGRRSATTRWTTRRPCSTRTSPSDWRARRASSMTARPPVPR